MAKFGGKLRVTIGVNTTEVEKALKELSKNISDFGKKLTSFGKNFSVSVSAPLAAWGAASVAASAKIKDALNDVAVGTGATGEALAGLKADFRAIAGQVPDDMSLSAKAIADLNTMLGVSGVELQEMAKVFLNVSRITKSDLGANISTVTKLMNNWGIATSRATEMLDKLLVASQNTGVSIDSIARGVTSSGAALRTMGVSVEESMALVGQLDKAGLDAQRIIGSLQRAMGSFAKSGVKDFASTFRGLLDSIKSESIGKAIDTASSVFGRLAGPALASAIREGRLEVNALTGAILEAVGAEKTFTAETEDFSSKWGRITNQMTLALEPLGTRILKIAEEYLPDLSAAIEAVSVDFSDTTIKIGMFLAALGPGTLLLGAFTAAVSSLVASLKTLYVALAGPGGVFIALSSLGVALLELTGQIKNTQAETDNTAQAFRSLSEQVRAMTMEQLRNQLSMSEHAMQNLERQAYMTQKAIASLENQRAKIVEDNIIHTSFGGEIPFTKGIDTQLADEYQTLERINGLIKNNQQIIETANKRIKEIETNAGKTVTPKGSSGELSKLKTGGKAKTGKSKLDLFVENVQDRMKYLNEDGQNFIDTILSMQSKLKPLSEDWKKLEDLRLKIDTETFDKSIQDIQDQMKYLDQDGTMFLPQLQDMLNGFDLLSEKGKKIADVMKPIMEEAYNEKWSTYSWEYAEGLLKASEYAELLKDEVARLTEGTDKWRSRFSELQSVTASEVSKVLEKLSEQFDSGKIGAAGYESALNSIIQEFADFPKVVQAATDALEAFHKQNELTALSTGQQLTNALKEATKDFRELQGQGILGVTEGFLQASIYGQDFGESLKKLGQDIVYTTLKMVILSQVTKWLGSFFGMSFGGGSLPIPLMDAKGDAFRYGHRITAYAQGGLVNKPTVFAMANGGIGLMGEAGTEAVMPLTRDRNGRLGVYAQGQGTNNAPTVIINLENQSGSPLIAEQSGVSFDEQFNKAVVQVVLRDQATFGPITRNFRRR